MATSSSFPLLTLPWAKPSSGIQNGSQFRVAAVAIGKTQKDPPGDLQVEEEKEEKKKKEERSDFCGLSVLYDDGFGTKSVRDFFAAAKDIVKPDGGPPRWFCPVECGQPIKNAPVLFFLPGIDGTGMGLTLHQKSLGKVFEVRCLHIPVNDRTPFEGLVKFVEKTVKHEHASSPNRPIYLVGDSFGGCLALAVAARNPSVDLVLVLVNPATSYYKSPLQPVIPVLEAFPSELHTVIPYALSLIMGDPLKMAMGGIMEDLSPQQTLIELSKSLSSMLPLLSDLTDILPKDTFLWKLKLLKSASAYSNSRLHAVEAEVLVLASGNDNLLPSGDEADRLWASLKRCRVRYFKDNGHTLLLENGFNLLTIIKGTATYRRSRQHDFVTDYFPPTSSEFRKLVVQGLRLFRLATSPVLLSTLENGRIVRDLSGVPNEGPVLLVGYHMLMGLELISLYEAFLREKHIIPRGMAHPFLFTKPETSREEFSHYDFMTVFGGLPVTPINMYKLLSENSFVLLYPGGVREALHRKGEEYKLFWPDQPEFVRMAARFGATIVPFGAIGEDDISEMVLDYNDQKKIPFAQSYIEDFNQQTMGVRLRTDMDGEVAEQDMYLPALLPKVPGRFYYLFGKPIETRGIDVCEDRESAKELYLRVKSEIEGSISYLKKKREEDPYRSILQRTIYQNSSGSEPEVPTFNYDHR